MLSMQFEQDLCESFGMEECSSNFFFNFCHDKLRFTLEINENI